MKVILLSLVFVEILNYEVSKVLAYIPSTWYCVDLLELDKLVWGLRPSSCSLRFWEHFIWLSDTKTWWHESWCCFYLFMNFPFRWKLCSWKCTCNGQPIELSTRAIGREEERKDLRKISWKIASRCNWEKQAGKSSWNGSAPWNHSVGIWWLKNSWKELIRILRWGWNDWKV